MSSEPIVQIPSTCNSPLEEAQAEEDAQSALICLVLQVPMAHNNPFSSLTHHQHHSLTAL